MKNNKKALFLCLTSIIIFACSKPKKNEVEPAPTPMPTSPLPAAAPDLSQANQSMLTLLKNAEEKEPQHVAHASPAGGVEPEKALGWLKNGNVRYIKQKLRADGQSPADRSKLVKGQKPHSIILSCSDSRLPPEIVFDQKLGEVFVIRTAGEALDDTVVASIEYAVSHLGSRLLVVMGHTSCGAIKAAIDTLASKNAGSPSLNYLVSDIHPRIQNLKPQSQDFSEVSFANAVGVAKDLVSRSSIIAEKVANHDLKIVSALYHMDSGVVEFEQ